MRKPDHLDAVDSIKLGAKVVRAYVKHNPIAASDLPKLLSDVYATLEKLADREAPAEIERQQPAVQIRKSITPDYIVCLENGERLKSLKRHLRTHFGMTPEQYREKWKLAPEYPMVAPNYSATRSSLAKSRGLGRKPGTKVSKSGKTEVTA